jgi:hypothetical protein
MRFEFKYRDPDEDQQEADKATTWTNTAMTLVSGSLMTKEQAQRLLANQVSAVADVITDESGEIVRLDDSDPETPEQQVVTIEDIPDTTSDEAVIEEDKALRETQQSFKDVFTNIISQANLGAGTKAVARLTMRQQLQLHGEQAYLDGLRAGGVQEARLDNQAIKEIAVWRAAQTPFISKFIDDVYSEKDFNQATIQQRANLWVNKSLNPLYYIALGNADKNALYMWVYDPRKEHCKDCLRLNGQIHKMKDYVKKGILPQSPALECKGYNCGCSLVPSQLSARGKIGGKPSGIRGIFSRILNLFKRG